MSRRPTALPLAERLRALGYTLDTAPDSLLLHASEASAYIAVAPSTLEEWRYTGRGPICRRIGDSRRVAYALGDLRAWLAGGDS